MKSLILFLLMVLFGTTHAQNVITVVRSESIDSADRATLKLLAERDGDLKAVVLVLIDGKVQDQSFIAKSRPCQCDPKEPNHWFFISETMERMVIELSPKAKMVVDNFGSDVPNDLAKLIAVNSVMRNR